MFWSKKKSTIEQIRDREAKEKEQDNILVIGKRSPEQNAEIESKRLESTNEKELEEPRKEREIEEKAEDDLKLVIDTAKLECKLCSNPQGLLKVNYDTPTIQEKKTATVKEKSPQSLLFMGTCSKSPQSSSPCASVMQLGEWKDIGTSKSQEERVLLQKSTIKCDYGGIDIKIADCGQINEPESIATTGAPVPEDLDDKNCYCNRNITDDEMKEIVVALRKGEILGYNSKKIKKNINGKDIIVVEKIPFTVYDSIKTKDFLFANQSDVNRAEHISVADSSYVKITQSFNDVFNKYNINTCIRKIHFIAQTYHESHRFRATFEGRNENNTPKNYKGGFDFQGRGIKQITHDYNYLEYYDFVNETSLFKDKYGKHKIGEGVTEFVLRVKDKELNYEFINNKLVPFAKKLSTELYHVFNSAGWFWSSRKINGLADNDDILNVSRKINGASGGIPNGMKERTDYTNNLKKIFNYEKCINK